MIIDNIDNAEKYYGLHSEFRYVFEKIKENMMCSSAEFKNGTCSVKTYWDLEARDRNCLYEYHKRFIDIHVCLKDVEIIEFSDRSIAPEQRNEEEDMYLSNGIYAGEVRLTAGEFAIFFAGELHKPQIGEAGYKMSKCIAKVRA